MTAEERWRQSQAATEAGSRVIRESIPCRMILPGEVMVTVEGVTGDGRSAVVRMPSGRREAKSMASMVSFARFL